MLVSRSAGVGGEPSANEAADVVLVSLAVCCWWWCCVAAVQCAVCAVCACECCADECMSGTLELLPRTAEPEAEANAVAEAEAEAEDEAEAELASLRTLLVLWTLSSG